VLGKNGKAPLGLDLPVNKGVIPGVVDSDEFNRTNGNHTLPLVWQWNHNPDESQWSLSDREGYFRLYAGSGNNGFHQVRNILTQRTFGPVCSAVVAIDVSHLQEGDFAGLSLFQKVYGQVGVRVRGGKRYVEMVNGDGQENSVSESILLKEDRIYLKASCDFRERADKGNFSYSLDGENWKPIGRSINMVYSIPHFMGYRFAMFCYSSGESGGFADFDWFRVNPEI
jgi:beta-xylosidase